MSGSYLILNKSHMAIFEVTKFSAKAFSRWEIFANKSSRIWIKKIELIDKSNEVLS